VLVGRGRYGVAVGRGVLVDVGYDVNVGYGVYVGYGVPEGIVVGALVTDGTGVFVGATQCPAYVFPAHAVILVVHFAPFDGQQYVPVPHSPTFPATLQTCWSPSGSAGQLHFVIIQFEPFRTFLHPLSLQLAAARCRNSVGETDATTVRTIPIKSIVKKISVLGSVHRNTPDFGERLTRPDDRFFAFGIYPLYHGVDNNTIMIL